MNKHTGMLLSTIAVIFSVVTLCTTSCKKSNNKSSADSGIFYFHVHTDIDTNEVDDTTALYSDALGRHFGLSTAQFYISGIKLHNVNGSTFTYTNTLILKNIDSEQYLVGKAPVGTYDYVTFNVGLSSADQQLSPTAFINNGYISNSTMLFSNTSTGYMYLKVQGFADTTSSQNGTNLVRFSYETGPVIPLGGSDEGLKTVTMPTRSGSYYPYILTAGSTSYIHLICDYGKLLSGINFKTMDSTDTHSMIYPNTADTIIRHIPTMFRYEE